MLNYTEFNNINIDRSRLSKQYKNYFKYLVPYIHNPLTTNIGKKYSLLEGITKTYPAYFVKKHISKYPLKYKANDEVLKQLQDNNLIWYDRVINSHINTVDSIIDMFRLDDWQIDIIKSEHKDDNTPFAISIIIPNVEDNLDLIDNAMMSFGYFRSKIINLSDLDKYKDLKDWIFVKYDALHQEHITDMIHKYVKYLYHVSPSKYKYKILKQGLAPKPKSDFLNYPDRIYTSCGLDKNELKHLAENLYTKGEFVVYRIDVSKLNCKFYIDYNFPTIASFYTYENIPKDCLEIVDEFEL